MAKKVNKGNFNPQDEAIRDKEHINHEALAEAEEFARHSGAPHASPILPSPSNTGNPYISEEDQGMEMTAVVVGPPQYGSPDPTTAAGRLLPLDQHPLNVEALPEGHPAAIADDYGEGYGRTLVGGRPSRSDLERHLVGDHTNESNDEVDATDSAKELANEHGVDLNDVAGTGADGRVVKSDVQEHLDKKSANNGNDDVDATEAALELANENNVALNDVVGTGADGRVTKDDVQAYLDKNNGS